MPKAQAVCRTWSGDHTPIGDANYCAGARARAERSSQEYKSSLLAAHQLSNTQVRLYHEFLFVWMLPSKPEKHLSFKARLTPYVHRKPPVGIHHAALNAPSRNTALLVGMLVHAGVCENQWLLPVQCPEHNVQQGNTDTKIRPWCFEMVYHVPPFLSG